MIGIRRRSATSSKFTCKYFFDGLPIELKHKILSYCPLESLHNLNSTSKRWSAVIKHAPPIAIPTFRRRLLILYWRLLTSPIWPALQTDLIHIHLPPTKPLCDREAYLDKYSNSTIGDEFRQWIREWPSRAPIGWLGPDLPLLPPSEAVRDKAWYITGSFNVLDGDFARAPSRFAPEECRIMTSKLPSTHPIKNDSEASRAAQGWGALGWNRSERWGSLEWDHRHGEYITAYKLVLQEHRYGKLAMDVNYTYVYTDGAGPWNGTVWRDSRRAMYREFSELDEQCQARPIQYVKIGSWFDFLENEIKRLEKYHKKMLIKRAQEACCIPRLKRLVTRNVDRLSKLHIGEEYLRENSISERV